MLADIYNWFIEGFDTADLKDAKALLVQWSGLLSNVRQIISRVFGLLTCPAKVHRLALEISTLDHRFVT
jgi:hypothetical protein